jgi:HEAT repeat protein
MRARAFPFPVAFAAVIGSAIVGSLGLTACVHGQATSSDRVQAIRLLLRESPLNVGDRDQRLCDSIAQMVRLDDLARVLSLPEWNVEALERPPAENGHSPRAVAFNHFEEGIRAELESSDTERQMLALDLLIETGKRGRPGIVLAASPRLTEALVRLLPNESAIVGSTAAAALARVGPDPGVAIPALDRLLDSREPERSRAAVHALAELLENARQGVSEENERLRLGPIRERLLRTATLIVPAAGVGLWSRDVNTRRLSAALIGQAAEALNELVHDPRWRFLAPENRTSASAENSAPTDCDSLVVALNQQKGTLSAAMRDPDEIVRTLSGRAVEQMALAAPSRDTQRIFQPSPSSGDAKQTGYRKPALGEPSTLPADARQDLAALVSLKDLDVQARLNAIDVLESLGPGAAAAVPDLVQALSDSNAFVRWAAARTLGKIGPTDPGPTAAALGRLLNDADPDIRQAAAGALERYGPKAQSALPDLVRALPRSDPALRLVIARVLLNIGSEARSALPDLRAAAQDPDPRVRRLLTQLLAELETNHARDR